MLILTKFKNVFLPQYCRKIGISLIVITKVFQIAQIIVFNEIH